MSPSPETRRPCVLFVDDDLRVLADVPHGLRRGAFDVVTAHGPMAALAELAKREIDVVVSDEHMPRMCGTELLTLVRERYPDTCRIVLSGQAELDTALRAINDARVFRFLTKPCSLHELVACIDEGLAARDQRRALERAADSCVRATAERTRRLAAVLPTVWLAIQPIVHAATGDLFAYEILARCEHPEVSTPMALFALAEQSDAVVEVERMLRGRAADLLRSLPTDAVVFVNIHPQSLDDPEFLGDANPLVPFAHRVVLELIERARIPGGEPTAAKIASLRARGFRVAIDDLGAGYNGLTTLTDMMPDVVKFDMALVRGLTTSPVKTRLLRALVEMCAEVGIVTVAEGIETVSERDAMRAIGCDLLQGYLFGQPKLATRELRQVG